MPQSISKEEKEKRQLRKLIDEYPDTALVILLETMFWPSGLETGVRYERVSDDTDGLGSKIAVMFSPDADSWIVVDSNEFKETFEGEDPQFTPTYVHRF